MFRVCSLFRGGGGADKWEGGQPKFTPLFRGGQKGFTLGGADKKVGRLI